MRIREQARGAAIALRRIVIRSRAPTRLPIATITGLILATSIALAGCAELATIAPAVSIDASAVRSARASTTIAESESWSWGLGVRLVGTVDSPAIPVARERRADALVLGDVRACRVPALCVWETRARTRALVRAWEIAREESER